MESQTVPVKELLERAQSARTAIEHEVAKRVFGQKHVVEHLLISLFSRGHTLMMGVPGLAKTLLVSTLSEALDLRFNRIQFTPDLMPSDITGTDILETDPETGARRFRFLPGPVFSNLLLADEINRTPPKTQAALLQAMQERKVSAGGKTYELEAPFLVFATQNPIEQEGTYPLPEAQLDRFLMKVQIDYPNADHEEAIVAGSTSGRDPLSVRHIQPFATAQDILQLQAIAARVACVPEVIAYAVRLVRATRGSQGMAHPSIRRAPKCIHPLPSLRHRQGLALSRLRRTGKQSAP